MWKLKLNTKAIITLLSLFLVLLFITGWGYLPASKQARKVVGEKLFVEVDVWESYVALESVCALMGGEHFEDVVSWGEDHLFAFGENHGLEDVHGLCDVGHADLVAVIVEYV